MNNYKNRLFTLFLLGTAILLANFGWASAQEKIKVSSDEAKAIKKIEEAKTLADKMNQTAEFIKKYPQSPARKQAATYIAGQIVDSKNDAQIIQNGQTYLTIFTEQSEKDIILPSMVYSFIGLNRYKEAFETAEEYLERHPEDISMRVRLAIEGSNKLRAGTKEFAQPARFYGVQSIEMIEANKKPAEMDDALWNEYQTKWLPVLYQSVGFFEFSSGDKAKARLNLEKAVKLNSGDLNSWVLLSTIIDDEYQELAQKYNVASAGEEREALLKQANEKMDKVIEMYARIVALSDGQPEAKELNEQVRQNLEQYYKYRHQNSTQGLPELINKYKQGSN